MKHFSVTDRLRIIELILDKSLRSDHGDMFGQFESEDRHFRAVLMLVCTSEYSSKASVTSRQSKICDEFDATLLFHLVLNRPGGIELAGVSVQDVMDRLLASEEFRIQLRTENDAPGDAPRLWNEFSSIDGKVPRWYVEGNLGVSFPVDLEFRDQSQVTLKIQLGRPSLIIVKRGLPFLFMGRFQAFLAVLNRFHVLYPDQLSGDFSVSLEDHDDGADIAFCSNGKSSPIPDSSFILRGAYSQQRVSYPVFQTAWRDRVDIAYWRGTDTGAYKYKDRLLAPRVAACILSQAHPEMLDARVTAIQPIGDVEQLYNVYHGLGILGPRAAQDDILHYKYQIDIDGNTNSWDGPFLKLLTGAPMLKVASEFGFRQWYYYKLVPWINFVPVSSDFSDLIEKIEFLKKNPVIAESIGKKGQELALSMTYASELDEGAAIVLKRILTGL